MAGFFWPFFFFGGVSNKFSVVLHNVLCQWCCTSSQGLFKMEDCRSVRAILFILSFFLYIHALVFLLSSTLPTDVQDYCEVYIYIYIYITGNQIVIVFLTKNGCPSSLSTVDHYERLKVILLFYSQCPSNNRQPLTEA